VPRISQGDEAIYLSSEQDDRLFFVIPWGDLSLIGTTDTDTERPPEETIATEEDIDYLLGESARHLHGTALTRDCVVSSFAGLRPLVADTRDTTSKVSREHRIFESTSGLISVGGGKYTTYRAVAEEVAELIASRLGKGEGKSRTARLPLPGGEVVVAEDAIFCLQTAGLSVAIAEALVKRYGSRVGELLALAEQKNDLLAPVVAGSNLTRLEVEYAVQFEQARTPDDILRRRTGLALEHGQGLKELEPVAAQMQILLEIDDNTKNDWIKQYREIHSRSRRS